MHRTLLQFSKKKRKRTNSEGDDDLDLDQTPPPSPTEEELGVEKRRSGRNTKRKKYVDDVQYNFDMPDMKTGPKDAAAIMDDILGPETEEAGATGGAAAAAGNGGDKVDTSMDGGDPSSGPNYAFVVSVTLLSCRLFCEDKVYAKYTYRPYRNTCPTVRGKKKHIILFIQSFVWLVDFILSLYLSPNI